MNSQKIKHSQKSIKIRKLWREWTLCVCATFLMSFVVSFYQPVVKHFQFSLFTFIACFYRTFVDYSWIFSICLIAHRYQIFNRFNSLEFTELYCFYTIQAYFCQFFFSLWACFSSCCSKWHHSQLLNYSCQFITHTK